MLNTEQRGVGFTSHTFYQSTQLALDPSYPCRSLSPPGRKGLPSHRALHNTGLPNMHCALHLISTPSVLNGFEHEHLTLSDFVPYGLNLEGRLPGNKTQP